MNFVISGMFKRLGGPVVCALDSRLRDPILDLQGLLCCGTRYSHLTLVYKWVLAKLVFGGKHSLIWLTWLCAAEQAMVFLVLNLKQGIQFRYLAS